MKDAKNIVRDILKAHGYEDVDVEESAVRDLRTVIYDSWSDGYDEGYTDAQNQVDD
jgi:hypothetical protein